MSLKAKILDWLGYLTEEVSEDDAIDLREEIKKFEDYVLVHKSRITELMEFSVRHAAYQIKVAVGPAINDTVFEYEFVRNCSSKEELDRFLKDKVSRARHILIDTLETPFEEGETP